MSGKAGLVALIASSVVSGLGSRVSMVAVPWLVFTSTGDPAAIGLVIVGQMVPYLVSSVFGTPVADRIGIRRSALIADAVSAVTTAVIAATPGVGLPTIIAMVTIAGLVRGVGDRTKNVLLRPAAETAGIGMIRVTSVYNGLAQGATLVGAPMGGLLIVWFGAQGAIWFDAGSYVVAGLIVATLVKVPSEARDKPAAEPYLTALRAGTRQLLSDRLLLGMMIMIFLTNMVNQANTAVFVPLWVSEELGSPAALGTLFGAFAAGAVAGNLTFTALAPRLPQYLTFILALGISGVPRLLMLALSENLGLILAVTFVCGFAVAAVNPIFGALLYERVPPDFQTRVFGLSAAVTFAGFPVGGMLGGVAVAGFGLTASILLGAGIYVAVLLGSLARYRTEPASPAPEPEAEPAKP